MTSLPINHPAKRFFHTSAGDHSPAVAFDAATSGNAVNQVQFTYNDFGQSIQTFQEHGGTVNTGTTPSVQRGYANGSTNTVRPLSLTYPNGRELTYDYGTTHEINDALSRIGSIVDDDTTHLVDYEFLGLAGVIQQTSPQPNLRYTLAGVSNDPDTGDIYTGLDRFGRVKDSRWFNTSTNDDLSRIQYGYDRASNRIWRKNPIATANSAEYDWLYTYDGLQRLKTANRGTLNGTQTALTSTAFKQDWNLDPTGNWEGFKQSDNGSTWSMEQERTANPVNEITDISNTVGSAWADPAYNAVGNMTTIPKPKQMDESYTATYDAWNRLVKLEEEVSSILETVAEYQYDARNFRIVVNNYESGVLDETIHAYFNDGWQNIEERLNPNSTLSQQHVWGLRYIDDCVLRDRTVTTILDERLYALQDANWNVTTIVDGTGDVEERFEYDVYGMKTSLSSFFENQYSTNNEWKTTYCGYVWDKETGLFSVRNRFYHKDVGVWNSRDPLGPLDGMNLYESLFSPNVTDPLGLVKGKAFGYVVRRVGSTLIRVRSIKSREAAAMCFAKGSDILITSGRKAAQNVAETLKGRIGKKAGRLMEHQGHPLPGGVTGLPHFQFDDIPYRHIFYSGLAALFSAGAVEASEDSSCLSDCTIEVDDIYEYTMEEDTIFKALTFSYYFGDNSTISYLDWVNPGELVAAGAQIGRDLDRYATSKLVGSMLTISCSDGTEATVTVDLDGNLRSVSMDMDGIPGFETLPGVEYLDKLERGEAPPIPGIPNGK